MQCDGVASTPHGHSAFATAAHHAASYVARARVALRKIGGYTLAVAYDPEAFVEHFLGGRLPAEVGDGFAATAAQADRVRNALDVVLEGPHGGRVVAFVERRVDGVECLTRTERFNLSYYPSESISEADAARAVRALAARVATAEGSAPRAPTVAAGTLELRINRECNERCAFCNTPEGSETILPGPNAVLELLAAEREAHDAVLLTGREPTLEPRLLDYVRRAHELGYARIRLQTNGTRLTDRAYLRGLVAAGLTEVEISLHTRSPDTFERLIGKKSLLPRTVDGIEAALDAGLRCHLVMVVTTLNLEEIPDLIAFVADRYEKRVRHVTLSPMAPVGDGAQALHLVPRLGDMTRKLPEIFEAARVAGIEIDVPSRCGMPLCAIPERYRERSAESHNRPGANLEAGKGKSTRCAGCRFDAICTGVWHAYLKRYGDAELTPIQS